MSSGAVDLQQIYMRKSHLEKVQEDVVEQEQKTKESEEAKDEQQEVLIKAVKDKEILEKDKDKKRDMWKEIMKKEEAKFMDEISAIGFVKKSVKSKKS